MRRLRRQILVRQIQKYIEQGRGGTSHAGNDHLNQKE